MILVDKINQHQKENTEQDLRRAMERIVALYTDKSHFIYELLQNAEDAGASIIKFVQYDDRLEVFHDGKPFTERNLQAICSVGDSDKTNDLNKIGEFGVGFKAVYNICTTAQIHSVPEHYQREQHNDVFCEAFNVQIRDFRYLDIINDNQEIGDEFTTKFVFPFSAGMAYSCFKSVEEIQVAIATRLKQLGCSTLLFMKNMKVIQYEIHSEVGQETGKYKLNKKELGENFFQVSSIENNGEVEDDQLSYLAFSRPIGNDACRSVDIVFQVRELPDGTFECLPARTPYISVYFPTGEESKLRFIVQGPYRTPPDRSRVPADNEENMELVEETYELLQEALFKLKAKGWLNLSFFKQLPLDEHAFDNYALFKPLYTKLRELFKTEGVALLPGHSGGYATVKQAKLAHTQALLDLFSDQDLAELMQREGCRWILSSKEENKEEYNYIAGLGQDKLEVRPGDLKNLFTGNPQFLKSKKDEWLISLYSYLSSLVSEFSLTATNDNLLTTAIVKTSKGEFIAPYIRSSTNRNLLRNVFLPPNGVEPPGFHFVDAHLYNNCRGFFDERLKLTKPDEIEYQVAAITMRLSEQKNGGIVDMEQHFADLKWIYQHQQNQDQQNQDQQKNAKVLELCHKISLRCIDGKWLKPHNQSSMLFLQEKDGVDIVEYFRDIPTIEHWKQIHIVASKFYKQNGIDDAVLMFFGVKGSLLKDEEIKNGKEQFAQRGRASHWETEGDFRYKLTIWGVEEALKRISEAPSAPDLFTKSKVIMGILLRNSHRLRGDLIVGTNTPTNRPNTRCKLLETLQQYDAPWVYTKSSELVIPREISRHDLHEDYGLLKKDSPVYDWLGFQRTEEDEAENLRSELTSEQLDALFNSELVRRMRDGRLTRDKVLQLDVEQNREVLPPFPDSPISNRQTLTTHTCEMWKNAIPVEYKACTVRQRVSQYSPAIYSHLESHYGIHYNDRNMSFCQACHKSVKTLDRPEIFRTPRRELPPMYLSLCPNCAALYRRLRDDNAHESAMQGMREQIINAPETDEKGHAVITVGDMELWFTRTHLAEVQLLLKLEEEEQKQDKS